MKSLSRARAERTDETLLDAPSCRERKVFLPFGHGGTRPYWRDMQFTDDDLRTFMEIYSAEFHEDISLAEAREMASRVMRLYEVLAEPLPSERSASRRPFDGDHDSAVS